MKKKWLAALLAAVLTVSLLPGTARAAEPELPEWNFLFAVFTEVDADVDDGYGAIRHITYSMPQEEIDLIMEYGVRFLTYMYRVGVMDAHVYFTVIDTPVTQLQPSNPNYGSYLGSELAGPILEARGIDLDQYDHIACVANLQVNTAYLGLTGTPFENGTGQSFINNAYYARPSFTIPADNVFPEAAYVHEFLHFMEQWSAKWGAKFDIHAIRTDYYTPDEDDGKECYTDIIHDRARGEAGTGVPSAAWQCTPGMFRNVQNFTVPDGVTAIGDYAFQNSARLKKVTTPRGVTRIGYASFYGCGGLESVTLSDGVTGIGDFAFYDCGSLESVSIPASVTEIGYAAFYNTALKDVYFGGTKAQWEAIQMDEFNSALTDASVHFNRVAFSDVPVNRYYADAVIWAVGNGYVAGYGDGTFGPSNTCTEAQILTFLWLVEGQPDAAASPIRAASWAQGAVNWAYEQGLINGSFRSSVPCTRLSAVTYLWKLLGSGADAPSAGFPDVPGDNAAINWAYEEGIIGGLSDGTFGPNGPCERGMIAMLLYGAYARSK